MPGSHLPVAALAGEFALAAAGNDAGARDTVAGRVNTSPRRASNEQERNLDAKQDRALVEAARRGDHAAFRRLVEKHQRRAFAIAFGIVRDENDARELVQEAFLHVHRGLGQFQAGSTFFTWFYRIVKNLSIDLVRRPGRHDAEHDRADARLELADVPLVSRIDGSEPLDFVRRRELQARLGAALDALPPYHRAVVLMREVEGMSYAEMAQAMNVSQGTVMSRLFHARQKLQRALADCYVEEGGRLPEALAAKLTAEKDAG